MGLKDLFAKKTVTCERCGKEYQVRITLGAHVCDECLAREQKKKDIVRGYVDYASDMFLPMYTEEQLDQIAAHRDQILEKYRMTVGISKAELQQASDNYKTLSDDEAEDVLMRAVNSTISSTTGASYSKAEFFAPTAYEKTFVDAEDVFAVGYTNDFKLESSDSEILLCAVFTNDPYIPVFPMIYLGKLGLFELTKSKKGRAAASIAFEGMCPNLTYPVQDLKKLKKQIKDEGAVRGSIDMKFMLDRISDASLSTGIFDTKKMVSVLPSASVDMLEQYGFIMEDEVNKILKMDKMFNRNYWEKRMKHLIEQVSGD